MKRKNELYEKLFQSFLKSTFNDDEVHGINARLNALDQEKVHQALADLFECAPSFGCFTRLFARLRKAPDDVSWNDAINLMKGE